MSIFRGWPYTNFHDLNLDRILERTQASEAAAQAAEAAAEAAAASIEVVKNYPATAYKELTQANGYVTPDSTYLSSALGRMVGFIISGGSLILDIDGTLLKSSLSFTAGTKYKLWDLDESIEPFVPEKFYVVAEGMFDNTTALKIYAAKGQTQLADGIYIQPKANFTTSGTAREIECSPCVVPFFTDIA